MNKTIETKCEDNKHEFIIFHTQKKFTGYSQFDGMPVYEDEYECECRNCGMHIITTEEPKNSIQSKNVAEQIVTRKRTNQKINYYENTFF